VSHQRSKLPLCLLKGTCLGSFLHVKCRPSQAINTAQILGAYCLIRRNLISSFDVFFRTPAQ